MQYDPRVSPNATSNGESNALTTSGYLNQRSYQGVTGATGRGNEHTVLAGKVVDLAQAADADLAIKVEIGALHGSAGADASTSGSTDPVSTVAQAKMTMGWFDTVTFHTTSSTGSDFILGLTLNDSLSTSLGPDAFLGDSFAAATVSGLIRVLYTFGGTAVPGGFLGVQDIFSQRAGSTFVSTPSARSVTTMLHAFDGQTYVITGQMDLSAKVSEATGTAGASAMDTALFQLSTLDAGASYTAASGTIFATGPEVMAPVPEPSELALMLAGLSAMVFTGRRRLRSARRA